MAYQIAGVDVRKKMLAVVVADVEVEGDSTMSAATRTGSHGLTELTYATR